MWIWVFAAFMLGGIVGIFTMALITIVPVIKAKPYTGNQNTCVLCGDPIPEGRQVCPVRERRMPE